MTDDKTLPEDEAGDDQTLTSPGAEESEDALDVDDIDTDDEIDTDDIDTDDIDTVALDEDRAGEDLALTTDEDDPDYVVVDDEAEELTEASDEVDDTPDEGDPEDMVIDDEEQLAEAESVAAKAKSSRPVKRKVTTAPVKKDKPTPTQKASTAKTVEKKRTTPAGFVGQSVGELRKVIWPTGDQLREYFIVVLVFVLIIIAIVGLLDLGFGRLLLWLLT